MLSKSRIRALENKAGKLPKVIPPNPYAEIKAGCHVDNTRPLTLRAKLAIAWEKRNNPKFSLIVPYSMPADYFQISKGSDLPFRDLKGIKRARNNYNVNFNLLDEEEKEKKWKEIRNLPEEFYQLSGYEIGIPQ